MRVHGRPLALSFATVDLTFDPGEVEMALRLSPSTKIQVLAASFDFQQSRLREPCVGDIRAKAAGYYIRKDGTRSQGRWKNNTLRLDEFPAEVQDRAITEIEKALSSIAPITTLDRSVTR